MTLSPARLRVEAALVPVKLPIAALIGTAIGRRGTDVTDSSTRRSCLVLAPHPDDETLGCGATVMRRVDAGTAVAVVVITDGSTWPPGRDPAQNIAVRDAELRTSCRILGLPDDAVTHLAFPETRLHTAGEALVDAVADAVRTHTPDDVLVTSEADPHSDHAALGTAARPGRGRHRGAPARLSDLAVDAAPVVEPDPGRRRTGRDGLDGGLPRPQAHRHRRLPLTDVGGSRRRPTRGPAPRIPPPFRRPPRDVLPRPPRLTDDPSPTDRHNGLVAVIDCQPSPPEVPFRLGADSQ